MKTWTKRIAGIAVLSLGALAVVAPSAQAGTQNSNFVVQVTVDQACTFATTNLTFPNFPTGSAFNVNGSTTFSITCPGSSAAFPTPVTLTMNPQGPNAPKFEMNNGGNVIPYSLCNDAACTQAYAAGVAGPTQNISSGAAATTYTLYGQIPSTSTNVPANLTYNQTVQAVLTY